MFFVERLLLTLGSSALLGSLTFGGIQVLAVSAECESNPICWTKNIPKVVKSGLTGGVIGVTGGTALLIGSGVVSLTNADKPIATPHHRREIDVTPRTNSQIKDNTPMYAALVWLLVAVIIGHWYLKNIVFLFPPTDIEQEVSQ